MSTDVVAASTYPTANTMRFMTTVELESTVVNTTAWCARISQRKAPIGTLAEALRWLNAAQIELAKRASI